MLTEFKQQIVSKTLRELRTIRIHNILFFHSVRTIERERGPHSTLAGNRCQVPILTSFVFAFIC